VYPGLLFDHSPISAPHRCRDCTSPQNNTNSSVAINEHTVLTAQYGDHYLIPPHSSAGACSCLNCHSALLDRASRPHQPKRHIQHHLRLPTRLHWTHRSHLHRRRYGQPNPLPHLRPHPHQRLRPPLHVVSILFFLSTCHLPPPQRHSRQHRRLALPGERPRHLTSKPTWQVRTLPRHHLCLRHHPAARRRTPYRRPRLEHQRHIRRRSWLTHRSNKLRRQPLPPDQQRRHLQSPSSGIPQPSARTDWHKLGDMVRD